MNGVAWHLANQEFLMAQLERVRASLSLPLGLPVDLAAVAAREVAARAALPTPSALDRMVEMFRLTPFEREIVLLCAAAEILPAVGEACASLHGDGAAAYPSFGIALAYLADPSWASFTPEAPLRRFRLIELSEGPAFTRCRIRMPERVLHFLCGVACDDPALERLSPPSSLVASHEQIAEAAVARWQTAEGDLPPVVLVGAQAVPVAARIAQRVGLTPYTVSASELPPDMGEIWTREALLRSAVLVVQADAPDRAMALAKRAKFPLVLLAQDDLRLPQSATYEVFPPSTEEMATVWRRELGPAAQVLNGQLETLAGQFRLSVDEVRDLSRDATEEDLAKHLWAGARRQSRQALEGLAHRIDSQADWGDLVLPDSHLATLHQLVGHVRQRAKVYHTWGFAGRSRRGLAISALFSGPSGTGKTLASEVIAGALGLDLYQIDLSQIVSKYIGETEKNLRRIFDAAEGSGAVLLFDEADALFGKRSEVRDSHDRYANIEVAYLLQRMEAYSGLVILTTNLKNTLDPAFMRRIRFALSFPFPEHEDRRRIWESVFPSGMPHAELDVDRLATLSLAGGSIRNIALNAAFLAADAGAPVGMDHLIRAARGEFAKLERPMTELEAGGLG